MELVDGFQIVEVLLETVEKLSFCYLCMNIKL